MLHPFPVPCLLTCELMRPEVGYELGLLVNQEIFIPLLKIIREKI